MSVPNQWAIRDVARATFYDLVTGKAKIQLNTLKMSNLENTSATVYARGGSGNPRVVGFTSDREAKSTLQDCLFTNEVIAMMTGNDVATGATALYQREVLTVSSNAVTLSYTPSTAGALLSVYQANADGTHGTEITYAATPVSGEYKVSSKTVTFFTGDQADNSQVIVYYKVNSDATAKKLTVSTDKFAGSYKLVLDVLVRDAYTKTDYAAQIVAPNAKIEDNWKIDMTPTGDPGVYDIPIEFLKSSGSTDLYTMTIYDESLLT